MKDQKGQANCQQPFLTHFKCYRQTIHLYKQDLALNNPPRVDMPFNQIYVCCRSKERIKIYLKIGRSTKRFVFCEFIYFVNK